MKHLLVLFSALLFFLSAAQAQQTGGGTTEEKKHLIYFKDKANTPYSLQEPQRFLSQKALDRRNRQGISLTVRDLPVNPAYVDRLKQEGVAVWYISRWFNAAVVQCTPEKLATLEALPFVKSTQTVNRVASPQQVLDSKITVVKHASSADATLESKDYGLAYHQADMLGADELHKAGFRGEGVTIAVLDAGFPGVNTNAAFAHLFQDQQLKGTYDFVSRKADVFGNDSHGTSVLSTMAAYAPGKLVGTAYKANYYLFRTEEAASEHNIEEINWLLAAEFADSAGADIINSSLGYTTFDAPSESYTYNQLNGNTTLVTKAADFAAATGMLVVVSAGNEGNKPWRYISAPADADSVLTVGAVDSLYRQASFSSFGPTADGRIKPDVAALGQRAYFLRADGTLVRGNGTSFSAPILAGMAACLWQADYSKTNLEMIGLLRRLGRNASSPNNAIGYGVPQYNSTVTALPGSITGDGLSLSNPVSGNELILTVGDNWAKQSSVVHVLDVTGKLLLRQVLPASQSRHEIVLPPQLFPQGLYLCRVSSGSRNSTLRFVKL
ncbi:S8 family serine peptidase [Pontibacter ruber]|uniref:S8 family serine peptidase n=1 Tax=Pontibacter ruber TaxID=1343895 RepID=A0ABW5CVG7_9BACT|nr:S8 family serine peptidase [Pontibacter ruber]